MGCLRLQPIKFFLFPFSLLYGLVTSLRNRLFDFGFLKSTAFAIPIISVGNLSVGGTGKTPHTEYILEILGYGGNVAVLSRGYRRKTTGFRIASIAGDNALTIGDESYQLLTKHPSLVVAVDEKRVHGVQMLLNENACLQTIVLDDAFQHRYIHPGLSILLTDYAKLYKDDCMLPAGSLREWESGSKRADIIIVTKCPSELSDTEIDQLTARLDIQVHQKLFFSAFDYQDIVPVFSTPAIRCESLDESLRAQTGIVFMAGIVKPKPAEIYLQKYALNVETMFFPDHYTFKKQDYDHLLKRLEAMSNTRKFVVVTEKDAARLKSDINFPDELKALLYALPIKVRILQNQESHFIQLIQNYVVDNSRNG